MTTLPRNRTRKAIGTTMTLIALSISSVAIQAKEVPVEPDQASEAPLLQGRWHFPNFPIAAYDSVVIDTDPGTRGIAMRRLIDRLGYTANVVASADRIHALFPENSSSLSESDLQSLNAIAISSTKDSRLVVTGYAGSDLDYEDGVALALDRAQVVATALKSANPDLEVRVDSSAFWGGPAHTARRTEVFRIKAYSAR